MTRNVKLTTSRLIPAHPFCAKYQKSQITPQSPTIMLMSGECSNRSAGVSASLVSDASGVRLSLRSSTTGARGTTVRP